MKKLLGILLAVTLLLGFGAGAAHAQTALGTVAGKAVRWTGEPVVGATIRALAGPLETDKEVGRTTTAGDGSYSLAVPAGQAYWIHIDTFGSWWGYSYQVPFTLRSGEVISEVYFALGPRAVKEITLPAPVSNVAPATGTNPAPPQVQTQPVAAPPVVVPAAPVVVVPATPPAAPPAAQKRISNVKPAIGYHNVPAAAQAAPRTVAQPAPRALPATGSPAGTPFWALLAGGLGLLLAGLAARRHSWQSR